MVTIDNNFEMYSPYKSVCTSCKYFNVMSMKCDAFPESIPIEYLSGEKKHNKIDKHQEGDFIYQQI